MEKRAFSNPIFGGMRDFEETFLNRQQTFFEQVSDDVHPDRIDGSAEGLAAEGVGGSN
ncbi:MAG: hypothetical protein R2856_32340 [Caldilineaceae bacterium]